MLQEVITTCTRDCPNACGLIARVEKGKVLSLVGNPRHPVSRGFACRKCAAFLKRAYSPERILTPLKREGAAWRRIGWDAALDEIAGRMTDIRDRQGPEAILYYRGFAQRTALKLLNDRFFNLFGGVSGTRGTLCGGTGQAGQDLDFGRRISHDPADLQNSRSLVMWGRNPAATNPYLLPAMAKVRREGGRVILIDPVRSETAALCDQHIRPAPGSDAYLAMAAAKVILSREEEDADFLADQSEGFTKYREIIEVFTLDELASLCDVSIAGIESLADLLTRQRPTAILLGWGLHRWEYGHQTVRCIDALGVIAGIIGIPGGGVSQGFEEYAPYDLSWTGDGLHPERRRLLMPMIGEEILTARDPEIEMIFVTAGNPVCQAPNSPKVKAAFEKTPFKVVAGHFLDDTAQQADIFLPTTTFLEEQDVVASYGHNYVGPVNRAIEPLGECRSDFDIFRGLASRFPFAAEFDRPAEEWLALLLSPLLAQEIPMEELRQGPVRLPDAPMVPYVDRVFPTPSGRFRFITRFEAPLRKRDEAYPYHLLSVSPSDWLCSELTPNEQGDLTEVRINPEVARKHGLSDGKPARIVSRVGSTVGQIRISENEREDTVVFPRGKWLASGSSANMLTQDLVSKAGNGAPYYETTVRLEPAD
ncbi:MAG: molybdopterin-dependent oxidoreductase [Geobacter sp.]|nr:molybdopterin-dependent oxidoreductase [Geobacter sp.]